MKNNERYNIAPQMADYDKIGSDWKQYLMFFHHKLVNYKSVTTDDRGFRNTTIKNSDECLKYEDFTRDTENIDSGLLLGGSTAFGIGATHDSKTIPSLLNDYTKVKWFNYGGRAYNSTQEIILFNMFPQFNIKKMIVFSGINNALLSTFSLNRKLEHGMTPFVNQTRFHESMDMLSENLIGIKGRAKKLISEVTGGLFSRRRINSDVSYECTYEDILKYFERDLSVLKCFSKSCNFDLHFIFQPFSDWISKDLHKNEEFLFSYLDKKQGAFWLKFYSMLSKNKEKYINGVQEVCNRQDVSFFDMNSAEEFKRDEWLFVDRVHLTDVGYKYAAKRIIEETGL